MTVNISKPEQNLREELAALRAKVAAGVAQEDFWFSGDGATTTFALPRGWKPKLAFVSGALFRDEEPGVLIATENCPGNSQNCH